MNDNDNNSGGNRRLQKTEIQKINQFNIGNQLTTAKKLRL